MSGKGEKTNFYQRISGDAAFTDTDKNGLDWKSEIAFDKLVYVLKPVILW